MVGVWEVTFVSHHRASCFMGNGGRGDKGRCRRWYGDWVGSGWG